jgi:hypothetical protein
VKTTQAYRGYIFTITYQPNDSAYAADFPDLPDIITGDDPLTEASPHPSGLSICNWRASPNWT